MIPALVVAVLIAQSLAEVTGSGITRSAPASSVPTIGTMVGEACVPFNSGAAPTGTVLTWNGTAWVNGQTLAGNETNANCVLP